MDIISVMDDSLSNKIAAGEVVERPVFYCEGISGELD